MTNPAAERLRRMRQYGGTEKYVEIYTNPDDGPWHAEDVHKILSAYLTEHLPDDDVAIDADWWKVLVKDKPGGLLWLNNDLWLYRDRDGNIWLEAEQVELLLPHITTRGQLRLLATALGVELKEDKE